MPESDIIGAYDALAPLYEEYSSGRRAYLDAVDRLVIERLRPGARLLDIGSGDGRRLARIMQAASVDEAVAVEPSGEMARRCAAATGATVHQASGEEIDRLDIGEFDAATALWNIFGHIPGATGRLKTLQNLRGKLRPGGRLMLDVNNRHNALAYGRLKVGWRRLVDALAFDEARGDAHYQWRIGEQVFQASGHLFVPAEIEDLVARAGFRVVTRLSVNYATGEVSSSPFRGQLFYQLVPDEKGES